MEINLREIIITVYADAPLPVHTAASELATWFLIHGGYAPPIRSGEDRGGAGLEMILGSLEQPAVKELALRANLPVSIRHDGYVMALAGNKLLIYSEIPRGTVFACGYEWPRRASIQGDNLKIDFDRIIEQPDDDIRAIAAWDREIETMSMVAEKYRLNRVWMESLPSSEVLLPGEPGLWPYLEPHEGAIRALRRKTDQAITLGKARGLDVFFGSLASFWQLPAYLYQALSHVYPEVIATSYQGGSQWPPYEWQDRAQLCPSQAVTRRIYTAMIDELMAAHIEADGFAFGVGYDGFPLGCGCERCQTYSYADRFRDQVTLIYDVVVKKYGKKIWFWSWVVGGASAIPGYEHYYSWVKEFAEANPESVMIASFATEGDFNITHGLNPLIGQRGPADFGNVLIWPEYRGDGVVPAWLVDWMAESLPAYRAQGARGFVACDLRPHLRLRDVIQGGELFAFGELTWNADKTAEEVALQYCQEIFGEQAAPFIAAALRKSGEVIAKTLYLNDGPRFSGHSHIENDLRAFWDVYTLYDSAPFFLNEEQRKKVLEAGPPYQEQIEALLPGLAITDDNITAVMRGKDEAVSEAEWMIAQIELARPYLDPSLFEQLHTRCEWSLNYARLFRGLARAFFHLRMGRVKDGVQVIAGADEMAAAMQVLPQTGLPLPYDLDPQFGAYPWMITPPFELIQSLYAAGELLQSDLAEKAIGLFGCEEVAAALDSLYLPYERIFDWGANLDDYCLVVFGSGVMRQLSIRGDDVAAYVYHGGRLLLYNPSENWQALPSDWLPGSVQSWTCNHPQVRVTQPEHAITHGYASLKAEPITRFQATSAQVAEAAHYAPFIKSFLAVSNEWRTLTYPAVLAECAWGNGRILIDLIPENRTILLRCLSYLRRR